MMGRIYPDVFHQVPPLLIYGLLISHLPRTLQARINYGVYDLVLNVSHFSSHLTQYLYDELMEYCDVAPQGATLRCLY